MVVDVYSHVSDARRQVLHDKMDADFYSRKEEAARKNEELFSNMLQAMMADGDSQGIFLNSIMQSPEMQKTLFAALFTSQKK